MWKIGTKGRYGFLVSVVTTMFDFVLLNVGYLYAIHNMDVHNNAANTLITTNSLNVNFNINPFINGNNGICSILKSLYGIIPSDMFLANV